MRPTTRAVFLALAIAALAFHLFPFTVTKAIAPASIGPRGGNAYTAPVSSLLPPGPWSVAADVVPDSNEAPEASRVRLLEAGRALARPHSQHAEIEALGAGRYSHWGDGLVFSASDNSDPRANGRAYSIEYDIAVPWWIVAGLVAAAAFFASRVLPAISRAACGALFVAGCSLFALYCNWAFNALLAAPVVQPDSYTYLAWSILRTWGYPALLHGFHSIFGTWTLLPLVQLNVVLAGLFVLAYGVARATGSYFAGWLVVCLAAAGSSMIVSSAHMLTEAPFAALVMAHLGFALLYYQSGGKLRALCAGFALAAAILVKSVGVVLLGPLALLVLFDAPRRRAIASWILVPAFAAWVVPSGYDFARFGTFETSHAGGFALAGHVAWAIHPRAGSELAAEAKAVEDSIADTLAKRPAQFDSAQAYATYTANEYNILLWAGLVPRLVVLYAGLPPEPDSWWGEPAGGPVPHPITINRTLMRLAREAIAAEPERYVRHVAIHDLALWREVFASTHDLVLEADQRAEARPPPRGPAMPHARIELAPPKPQAERAAAISRLVGSAVQRALDLATLRDAATWLEARIFRGQSTAIFVLALLASAAAAFASRLSPAALGAAYAALCLHAYFLGTALTQPALVRYATVMQAVLAAFAILLVAAVFRAIRSGILRR